MRFLRARLSIPSLLSRADERVVVAVVASVNAVFAILTISLIAWLIDLPLLFPALGPTAFILFARPFSPAAAPRAVVLGHLSAIAVGSVSWNLVSLACGQDVSLEMGGGADQASCWRERAVLVDPS
jgi:CBS-domain-containing membrane protein